MSDLRKTLLAYRNSQLSKEQVAHFIREMQQRQTIPSSGRFVSQWIAQPVETAPLPSSHIALATVRVICERVVAKQAFTQNDGMGESFFQSEQSDIWLRFEQLSLHLFGLLGKISRVPAQQHLIQIVVNRQDAHIAHFALAGLLRVANIERPDLLWQIIALPENLESTHVRRILDIEKNGCVNLSVDYQSETARFVSRWNEIPSDDTTPITTTPVWKDNGTYLISGGGGALAYLFAHEIAAKTKSANIILIGRSAISQKISTAITTLSQTGARVQYHQSDVSQLSQTLQLVNMIRRQTGRIDGVIHAAGILRDSYLRDKTSEDLLAVMQPKLRGWLNLDEATRGDSLDLFVGFSSVASVLGNAGQADYALANAAMERAARARSESVSHGHRHGRTVCISWPLWTEGGMKIDHQIQQVIENEFGLQPMTTATGLENFYQCLQHHDSHVVVVSGLLPRLRQQMQQTGVIRVSMPVHVKTADAQKQTDTQAVLAAVTLALKLIMAELTKHPVHTLDAYEPFERYGFDSIMVTRLNQRLAQVFGSLSRTLAYEFKTIHSLAEYLSTHHHAACCTWTNSNQDRIESTSTKTVEVSEGISVKNEKNAWHIQENSKEAIAIIGLSGHYPDADSLDVFWENLKTGRDSISEIPADRWDIEPFFVADRAQAVAAGKSYSKWGGFVRDFANFDPLFFNIAPKEALAMDPQERLFIQSSWEVLEDACITRDQLSSQYGGRVGVFAGITKTSYSQLGARFTEDGEQITPRISFSSVPNRVSYLLNLNGPSMPIDTMCSSSLTAIHEACEHLLRKDCDLAIAGGVNLYLHPSSYTELSASGMLSDDGRCRSFGLGGNGFVPGEGVGCVLLKRLSEALADGDNIRAVIRATHVNHGGKTNGYSVPNPVAQRELIQASLRRAGVEPSAINYVEAHGTGTELGDPIEFDALVQALDARPAVGGASCALGSVKSNIGHLEAAAGIAGLTKVVLQMQHGQLVPSLHSSILNPNLDIQGTSLHIQQHLDEWRPPASDASGSVRLATVSSFGAGGANAHVVIQEHIQPALVVQSKGPVAIVLSARHSERLQEMVARLAQFVAKQDFAALRHSEAADEHDTLLRAQSVATRTLAQMLDVSENAFDLAVPLSDYGVCAYHMHALGQALREQVDTSIVLSDLDISVSLDTLLQRCKPTHSQSSDSIRAEQDFLVRMACSLQTGREEMTERLGFVVHSFAELRHVLDGIHDVNAPASNILRGKVTQTPESRQAQLQDQSLQEQLEKLIRQNNLSGLLANWVQGAAIDWRKLYAGGLPSRVSLPTYPFLRKRYWLGDLAPVLSATPVVAKTPSIRTEPVATRPESTSRLDSSSSINARVRVQTCIRDSLKISIGLEEHEIQNAMPFSDYGLDSILGVQLIKTLNDQLGIKLDTTVIFDHSSVIKLTTYICSTYASVLSQPLSVQQSATPQSATLQPAVANRDSTHTAKVTEISLAEQERQRAGNEGAIAIIGMSGKFPQSEDPEELWQHLLHGHDLITDVTRWPLPDPSLEPKACRKGGFLDGIDQFDSLFFNISGLEASYMDPQQRLFLEQAWKALEHAGYVGESIEDSCCGVYVGCSNGDYQELFSGQPSSQSLWGNMASVIASRIAYFLDLKGPALSIDTSCSSSLVALSMACKALWSADVDIALAGGVFVQATAKLYTSANRAGMLSPTGHCRAFDASADGFVPSEGVGAVVLKRLSDALQDGDNILGVIAGVGLNQDGATNGITAPSAKSQESLLREVYSKYAIRPDEIDLVEAHGTGTRLGDPIEFAALSRAFRAETEKIGYCALGSVKTNIGHSQFAAGIAGVIKVLLSLKYETIPPNLHFNQANSEIDFESSPFFVNTESLQWKAGTKRLACVSAFGASGTNAHVVISEAPAKRNLQRIQRPGYLMVLSARTSQQLKTYAKSMADYFLAHPELPGAHASFTLLAGRKHFEYRLACVVQNHLEFANILMQWIELDEVDSIYTGHTLQGADPDPEQSFANNQDLIKQLSSYTDPQEYRAVLLELAEQYVIGRGPQHSQVRQLFHPDECCRTVLPGYPFARMRHWITGQVSSGSVAPGPHAEVPHVPLALQSPDTEEKRLHPLLQRQSQRGDTVVYSCRLSKSDFFIADHRVQDQHVLPGVIVLEMAQAAYRLLNETNDLPLELSDVVWIQPCVVDQVQVVELRLERQLDSVRFSLCDDIGKSNGKVYAQGVLKSTTGKRPSVMHLVALRKMCQQAVWSSEQCSQAIKAIHITHGASMQCIEQVLVGSKIALAQLCLPEASRSDPSLWTLHPAMLDSSIQASIALFTNQVQDSHQSEGGVTSAVPFAMDQLSIFEPCTQSMFAVLRNTSSEGDATQSLDIDLCDEQGRVCVQIRGYRSRLLPVKLVSATQTPEQSSMAMLVSTQWIPADMHSVELSQDRIVVAGCQVDSGVLASMPQAVALTVGVDEDVTILADRLRALGSFSQLVWLSDRQALDRDLFEESQIPSQHNELMASFRLFKALLLLGLDARNLRWTVLTFETQAITTTCVVHAAHAGLHGLFGALAKEYLNWDIRLLDLKRSEPTDLGQLLTETVADRDGIRGETLVRRDGKWYCAQYRPISVSASNGPSPYRQGGVYIVVGGAGGVGQVWTESIVRAYQAKVIWIGRRTLDTDIQQACDKIAAFGPAPRYFSIDAADTAALMALRQTIRQEFGEIHGVVHSAIVLADQSLAGMDVSRLLQALTAKIDVSHALVQVFGNDPLDFVLFFSSVQSFSRMPGQSNYAAGSTYMDAYAAMAGAQYAIPAKVMNWGYWGNVGIVATPEYRLRMRQTGWESLEPDQAMQGLRILLEQPHSQLAMIHITGPTAMQGLNLEGFADRQTVQTYQEERRERRSYDDSVLLTPPAQRVQDIRKVVGNQMSDMDHILSRLLLVQLNAAGILTQSADMRTVVMQKLPPLYHRWMEQSFTVLEQAGLIALTAQGYQLIAPQQAQLVWSQWDREKAPWVNEPNRSAQILLVETMLLALPAILAGERLATDAMFPESSLSLVEGIYKNNMVADYFNEVLGDCLLAHIHDRISQDPSVRLRIIEIGAGTGGTTAKILPRLRSVAHSIEQYCYTDLSRAFLMHAKREYLAANPFLTCELFDAEKPVEGQKIAANSFDIAIATNVLHATRNIQNTLRNVGATLKPEGVLLLNELSDNVLFSHLTFGLLEGWWRYDDPDCRIPGSPGLYPEQWRQALEHAHFKYIDFPASAAHTLGQQVIVAHHNTQGYACTQQAFATAVNSAPNVSIKPSSNSHDEALRDKAIVYLKQLVAQTIQIPFDQIENNTPFERYGIDSILVVQITGNLRKVFSDVSSTLLFDVQTVTGLVEHFIEQQPEKIAKLVGLSLVKTGLSQPVFVSAERVAHAVSVPAEFIQPPQVPQPGTQHPSPATQSQADGRDIAIIGLSGRYPGADNVNTFWENLSQGKNCITEIPAQRWDWREHFDAQKGRTGKSYTRWGGFLENIASFDPLFFHLSPAEAEKMDPQERLFLQEAYAAIQDAGYAPASLGKQGRVGVFAGVMNGRYASGAAFWSVANRVSYLLNFTGPSLAIDSACSSSLTAIHLAVESLQSGMSDCALAGGVNLIVDPAHLATLSEMMMLSPGNISRSFGAQADGFVDGEGVGIVVLKRLKQAIADGDQIYGVIRGTAINASGKTSSYTQPSPTAQSRVIDIACQRAGVHPGTLSYIEAHGTGTALGDPIEIAGLTKAFAQFTNERQFCAIGSVKSNIGHSESAAGIAGLTKVLMQLKHKKLVPTLNVETVNPEIDFTKTPFYLQNGLSDWNPPQVNINGRLEQPPRRAGISSFGAGGANAHIVIEEYTSIVAERSQVFAPQIFLLSAKQPERLKQLIERTLRYFQANADSMTPDHFEDAAYTLQVGREHHAYRLAIVANDPVQLIEKLQAVLAERKDIADVFTGTAGSQSDLLGSAGTDEDMLQMFSSWASKGKFTKLLPWWVAGLSMDWQVLYPARQARRISLPTYPFAQETYWLARDAGSAGIASGHSVHATNRLHPLIHRNVSDFDAHRFASSFDGREFFLRDHVVQGVKMMPGVAYIEMAYAAIDACTPRLSDVESWQISNIAWIRPMTVTAETIHTTVDLSRDASGRISFEIFSATSSSAQALVSHCRGYARRQNRPVVQQRDIVRISQNPSAVEISAQQAYRVFSHMGIDYGPSHQAIQSLIATPECVLARLELIPVLCAELDAYVLHPVLMDAALQASIGLMVTPDGDLQAPPAAIPFSIEHVDVLAKCQPVMWAVIGRSQDHTPSAGVEKIDIDLCDEQGNICIAIRGFSTRRIRQDSAPATKSSSSKQSGTVPKPVAALDRGVAATLVKTEALNLESIAIEYFTEVLSRATKLDASRITPDMLMEEVGLDSIMVIKMTTELEETFGALSKTIFFENRTIREVADYFLNVHRPALEQQLIRNSNESVQAVSGSAAVSLPAQSHDARTAASGECDVELTSYTAGMSDQATDVAIIGLAGRYPQANTLEQFWENLSMGRDSITVIPADRWDHAKYFDSKPGVANKTYGEVGGFLDGVTMFDSLFFNISPRDAQAMDPQERIFMQCAYHAVQDAGYTREMLNAASGRSVGVYVGAMGADYQLYGPPQHPDQAPAVLSASHASIANRVSFFMDLNGPSLSLDTMCSSALTAIHMGCQAIVQGDCDMVIAGAVNLSLHPLKYLGLAKGKYLSQRGRCSSFGIEGDGYVPGEGVGAVVLKALSQAIADGDVIHGVIKASAINHGGKANGYTVPSPQAQSQVVARALSKAGIHARQISYYEAHGTGTPLGDPIEIAGLTKAFSHTTREKNFCAIGSVKSNIGHCEAAAGIAALTKVLLQMKHRKLVPSLHADVLNPNIAFADSPFFVSRTLSDWDVLPVSPGHPADAGVRYAGISSFGAGGANANIIVQESPVQRPVSERATRCQPALIVLSARTAAQLDAMVLDLLDNLRIQPARLIDIAYTLQTGREIMQERLGLIASSKSELIEQLELYLSAGVEASHVKRSQVRIANKKSPSPLSESTRAAGVSVQEQLELWITGHRLDWSSSYRGQPVWRVSLPGYRFAEQSFWVPDRTAPASAETNQVTTPDRVPALASDILLLRPVWASEESILTESEPVPARREIVLLGMPMAYSREFQVSVGGSTSVHIIEVPDAQVTDLYIQSATRLFEFFRALIKEKLRSDVLVQVVVHAAHKGQFQGLAGLLRTVRLENLHIKAQLIALQPVVPVQESIDYLQREARQISTAFIRYVHKQRQVWQLSEITRSVDAKAPWNAQGVYLITGGGGALGRLFAIDIARHSPSAAVILAGRKSITTEITQSLETMRQLGVTCDYVQVDVSQERDVITLMQMIRQKYGRLNGILHAAGHLHDDYILNKQTKDFQAVLQPKVCGTVWLDQYSNEQGFELELFVMFSSIASVSGNPGQSDYATANGFMDQYAEFRSGLRASGLRSGLTVSLNWPLWQEGGMRPDKTSEELTFKKFGLGALDQHTGKQAFYAAIASGSTQVAVLTGLRSKLLQTFNIGVFPAVNEAPIPASQTARLPQNFTQQIRQAAADTAKIAVSDIEADVDLSDYGFDSVMFTELANALNERCDLDLTPVIFFEYPTIDALSQYLESLHLATQVMPISQPVNSQASASQKKSNISSPTAGLGIAPSHENLMARLTRFAADLINVDVSVLDVHADLSEFGYDSITFAGLADLLNDAFSLVLSPAIFYEHTSIRALAHYLSEMGVVVAESRPASPETAQSTQVPPQFTTVSAARITSEPTAVDEPIAIVGMSGSFPMGADIDAFWDNLVQGKDCITEIPPSRWDWKDLYGDPHAQPGSSDVKWGGFIEDADLFDPRFFDISPNDAQVMDPQQRLLMLYVWRAIEDAGYAPHSLSGSHTGLFVATSASGYGNVLKTSTRESDRYTSTSMVGSVGPNRMSYFLNLHGPSEPIETACSSSLVALDRGVNALRHGGCDTVIVGAVNTMVTPDLHIGLNRAGMLSLDGRCKTFSAQANGYVRSEAVVMLVMKRQSDAQRSGDHIYGLVRGSAVNHGGRANSLTAPNPVAQANVIRQAFQSAKIDPRTVSMIEAHGTGTKLGDPIEVGALKSAFAEMMPQSSDHQFSTKGYCALGAVKSHVGHTELAAGLTGVVKVLMQFKHRMMIKNLHAEEINPYIDLSDSPFYLPDQTRPWPALQDANGNVIPRRAGVSSFGFGGVNAHVLLEEYQEPTPTSQMLSTVHTPQAIVLSAQSQTALRKIASNLVEFVMRHDHARQNEAVFLQDLAYTLQVGRDAMSERLAVVANTCDELIDKVQSFIDGETKTSGLFLGVGQSNQGVKTLRDQQSKTMSQDAREAMHQGLIPKLVSLWTQGQMIDWTALHCDRQPRRLRLPTYAFDLKRYWVETVSPRSIKVASLVPPSSRPAEVTESLQSHIKDTSSIARQVIRIISAHAGIDENEIKPETHLINLGIDSVSLMQLASNLIKTCGHYQSAVEANALLQCSQVRGLIQCFAGTGMDQASAQSFAANLDHNEKLSSVIKRYRAIRTSENLMCHAVASNLANQGGLVASVVVNTEHPFFFDHPLDHVSGMHLGYSMQQLAELHHDWSASRLSKDESFYTSQMLLNFKDICQLTPHAQLHAKQPSLSATQFYEVSVEQQGRTIAEGRFKMQDLKPESRQDEYLSVTRPQDSVLRQSVQASLVNKQNPANVLLADPVGMHESSDTGSRGAWLADQRGHYFFNQIPGRPVDIFVFAEAARQMLRLFAPQGQAVTIGTLGSQRKEESRVELLNKIEIILDRPLYWNDSIYLDLQERGILSVGDATRLRYEGRFMVDGLSAGRFTCEAMSLSSDLQRQWAAQIRNATISDMQ